ncbi:MAG: DUF4358 domain-containing protein [Ruminococcus sp.]
MKRIISVLLLTIFFFAFAGCTDVISEPKDITAIKERIITDLSIEGSMDLASSRLLDLYGIDESDMTKQESFVTMDGIFPDEVIMVEAKDSACADKVEEKLSNRLEEVKVQSQSYDAENYAVAQECKVLREGNTVALFLSPKHAEMEKIWNEN